MHFGIVHLEERKTTTIPDCWIQPPSSVRRPNRAPGPGREWDREWKSKIQRKKLMKRWCEGELDAPWAAHEMIHDHWLTSNDSTIPQPVQTTIQTSSQSAILMDRFFFLKVLFGRSFKPPTQSQHTRPLVFALAGRMCTGLSHFHAATMTLWPAVSVSHVKSQRDCTFEPALFNDSFERFVIHLAVGENRTYTRESETTVN